MAKAKLQPDADYSKFLDAKRQSGEQAGFSPLWVPDFLFDFQKLLVEWSIRQGRAALFEDCGLGKTPQQLVWAENVVRHTNRPVLILTPLAVSSQTKGEAEKFGIDATISKEGKPSKGITITNYERLHHFDQNDYAGVVCDESSILKNFNGIMRKQITRFLSKMPYRLLCTATAAPNDYIELGTSSESIGELSHSEMLKRFFTYCDDKKQRRETKLQNEAERLIEADPNYFKKLAFRISQTIGQWRLRHHAIKPFWRWVSSWAKACRKPSDVGGDDTGFILPKLTETDHSISPSSPPPGYLFNIPAVGLYEERQERKRTLSERCEFVSKLVDHKRAAVVWCHTNDEGNTLEKMIPGAEQIAGKTPDDRKVELYQAFADGQVKKLVIKPKIGAWGLNWQHCNHVVTFPTHSFEQYYQCVRRCWRYGQKKEVRLDVVATEGEIRVLANMRAKANKADVRPNPYVNPVEVPKWLS